MSFDLTLTGEAREDRIGDLHTELCLWMFKDAEDGLNLLTDEELGRGVREWLEESQHQGWDGVTPGEQISLLPMLSDMVNYAVMKKTS